MYFYLTVNIFNEIHLNVNSSFVNSRLYKL